MSRPVPPVLAAVHVKRPPEVAFRTFTERIGDWWPLATHGCFGDKAAGLSFVAGQLVERSVDGDTIVWGEVVRWEPPARFAVTWHPGRADGVHTLVEVEFRPDEDGTRVELAHAGWEIYGDEADTFRSRFTGPDAWDGVLGRYAGAVRTEDLATGYAAFLAEAEAGGFGPPPPGEWDARQLTAHLAVNDDLLTAAVEQVLTGTPARFDNSPAADWPTVTAYADRAGDLAAVLAALRASSARLRAAAARLADHQDGTEVDVFIRDGADIAVDQPMPVGRLLAVQAAFHLPAHTDQLAALRPR
jgi:Activator of Hsp90 ATPase homolog 1-like protein/DinB superfamily